MDIVKLSLRLFKYETVIPFGNGCDFSILCGTMFEATIAGLLSLYLTLYRSMDYYSESKSLVLGVPGTGTLLVQDLCLSWIHLTAKAILRSRRPRGIIAHRI